MAYKPIDDNEEYNANQTAPALHSAVAVRVKDNAADTQSKRLLRRGTSFHPGPSSSTNTLTFAESDLSGYFDPGITGNNPETKGFQFSTHPSKPMVMPLGWFDSAGGGRIKVRICMTVENAPMEMYAFALDPRAAAYPNPPDRSYNETNFGRIDGTFPDSLGSGFASTVTALAGTNYFKIPVTTAGPNTDGFSFFEFDIDLGKPIDLSTATGVSTVRNDTLRLRQGVSPTSASVDDLLGSVYVCIAFCSTADTFGLPLSVKNIRYSNKAISYNQNFTTLAPFGPGKIHALLEVPNGVQLADGTYANTYHHCIQVRPDDPFSANYGNTDAELLIHPQIPPTAFPVSLLPGATHNLFPLSKATVHSVSIEEELK